MTVSGVTLFRQGETAVTDVLVLKMPPGNRRDGRPRLFRRLEGCTVPYHCLQWGILFPIYHLCSWWTGKVQQNRTFPDLPRLLTEVAEARRRAAPVWSVLSCQLSSDETQQLFYFVKHALRHLGFSGIFTVCRAPPPPLCCAVKPLNHCVLHTSGKSLACFSWKEDGSSDKWWASWWDIFRTEKRMSCG